MKHSSFNATLSALNAEMAALDVETSAFGAAMSAVTRRSFNATISALNAETTVLDAEMSALDVETSAIARSYRRYLRGVFSGIGDCGVGITPQMCNRVTNHGYMSTFSIPATNHSHDSKNILAVSITSSLLKEITTCTICRRH